MNYLIPKTVPAVLLVLFFARQASAQGLSIWRKQLHVVGKDTLPYRILYPKNYNPENTYPILFFLHGRGESGNDNEKQLTHGGSLFAQDSIRQKFQAIVIAPQCPSDSYWANVNIKTHDDGQRSFTFRKGGKPTKAMTMLLSLVDSTSRQKQVDKSRIYCGGLSMGGMGTLELLRRRPSLFASAFAICGGDNVSNVKVYSHIPLWIFHGANDDIVLPKFSIKIAERLRRFKALPGLTIFPDTNHNSWDATFRQPYLLPWLFSKKHP